METLIETQFPLTQIREIFKTCENNKIDFREMIEFIDGDIDKFNKIIRSIDAEYCDFGIIIKEDTIEDNDYYYNQEEYVMTREGDIVAQDDANFCNYYDEYTTKDISLCYIYSDELYYSQSAINKCNLVGYNGAYYDNDALQYHDLIQMDNGEIESIDSVYYWESDNQYHYEAEQDNDEYVRDYHNGIHHKHTFTKKPKFFIGFEVEKEDSEVKESIYIDDFECTTDGIWRKESDGSLNDESGFELVSPTFELNTKKIFELIESNTELVKHINAAYSLACGGHINISQAGLTGAELFDKIQGYTPLFHALYYKRINKTYSKGKSNQDLKNSNEKYQSVKIHNNRVEYRIISAVPNINTMKWRCKLMELILKNQTASPQIAFFNFKTKFSKLISEMYQGEKLENLEKRIIKYSLEFEDISITR